MNSKAAAVVDTAAGAVVIAQAHRREQRLSAPDAASRRRFLSSPVAIVLSFARPATRRNPVDAIPGVHAAAVVVVVADVTENKHRKEAQGPIRSAPYA
jgi:hypothetical protein